MITRRSEVCEGARFTVEVGKTPSFFLVLPSPPQPLSLYLLFLFLFLIVVFFFFFFFVAAGKSIPAEVLPISTIVGFPRGCTGVSTLPTSIHLSGKVNSRALRLFYLWLGHSQGANGTRRRHYSAMRKHQQVVEWALSAASGINVDGHCSCEDIGYQRRVCDCPRDEASLVVMRKAVAVGGEGQITSLAPSLVAMVENPSATSSRSRSSTASTPPMRTTSSRSSSSATGFPVTVRNVERAPQAAATTILTITTASASPLSPATYTFTPTGIQSVVPTYPPFSASSSSTSTTNWSSLGTKLGLGLGIPILVLLTLLLTMALHRRQARLAKQHHHHHQKSPSPEMATTSPIDPAYPRLHPAPSSRFSTAGDVVVSPAPGITTPAQLYFPPPSPPQLPPPPPPPAVPRRSSARLLAGPLDSHPPVRPASSIYEGEAGIREGIGLSGNGVADVLAEYLDFNPQHLDGPWDPGQDIVPPAPLPPEPVAGIAQPGQIRQYLSVDVEHSPGGIDEVSPLSSSSSGPYMPARISAMSGLGPSGPMRTRSRRRM